MKTVTLRGVEIGTGRPKIIVPIVASTQAGILEQAAELKTQPLHMVEWRVDFYDSALDLPQVLETLHKLREVLEDIPILFTFRTQNEGGKKLPEPEDYVSINTAAAQSGDADAIDVEIFSGNDVVRRCISAAHVSGTAVVGSNHDFEKNPREVRLNLPPSENAGFWGRYRKNCCDTAQRSRYNYVTGCHAGNALLLCPVPNHHHVHVRRRD